MKNFKFLIILLSFLSTSALADQATFKLECTPCSNSTRPLNIDITHKNQNQDQANISEASKLLTQIVVYPVLPDSPDDQYSVYKGQTGTHFTLKIYPGPNSAVHGNCNSLVEIPTIGIDQPVELFCKVSSW